MVVSNRLPIRLVENPDGSLEARPSSGGLVTALRPVLRRRGGSWTGWPGLCGNRSEDLRRAVRDARERFDLAAVPLTTRERDRYYLGFSNQVLWPLLHGFPTLTEFHDEAWEAYRAVNWKFAQLMPRGRNGDSIWVQDYHLMLLGQALRFQGYRQKIGFFLHTPFPPPEVFRQLPCHAEILGGLLHYDSIGFQTERDLENFEGTLRALPGSRRRGNGAAPTETTEPLRSSHPISIDFEEWATAAASAAVTNRVAEIRRSLGSASHLLLGVDRLDYTKGIPARLRGFREALRRDPRLRRDVVLIQLVVPSRESVPAYQREKALIEDLAREINRAFGGDEWEPVRLIYGEWNREELMAHYRAADVALVTPLRDGMNLVSKEFCASRVTEPASLILSRYAGSANQLGEDAFLVDPREPEDVARAISRAVSITPEEAGARMGRLRRQVMEWDVHRWADSFLQAIEEVGPGRARPSRQLMADPRPSRTRLKAGSEHVLALSP